MPKIKYLHQAPKDYPRELIGGRLFVESSKTIPGMAEYAGVSERTMRRYLDKPTTEWPLGLLLKAAKYVELPIDELRGGIRYEAIRR